MRLREDVVARRTLREIEASSNAFVPIDKALLLTLCAPIKEPRSFVSALTNALPAALDRDTEESDESATILGNRIRFRVLNDASSWNARVLGFVFSGDPMPLELANAMRALRETIAASAKAPASASDSVRWLVLVCEHAFADAKTYRRALSLLSLAHDFERIVIVFDDKRVETLMTSVRS